MQSSARLRGSLWILGISAALGLLFDYLFFEKMPPGIGFSFFIACVVCGYLAVAVYARKSMHEDMWWLLLLFLFFGAMVAFRASPLLTALNVLACLGVLLVAIEVSVRGSLHAFEPLEYLKALIPIKTIQPFFDTCAEAISVRRYVGEHKHSAQIVRGILITIPVVVVFAALLSSADPVFHKYVSFFSAWDLNDETIARIVFFAAVAIAATACLSYAIFGTRQVEIETEQKRPFGKVEAAILLGSINALFLAFILVQITYLFGGESNIAAQGMTYAEYARRGFFELVAIAVLSYVILVVSERLIERQGTRHTSVFKILSSIFILQVGVLMVSAFYRMWLYEEAFGFTTLRVYVHAFIILLAVVFVFLLYKIVTEGKDSAFAFRTFLALVVFVVGMNLFNPDAFIAEKNLQRFTETGKIDALYLAELSSDATPVLLAGLGLLNGKDQYELGHVLYWRQMSDKATHWMQWNWSRAQESFSLRSVNLDSYAKDIDLAFPAASTTSPVPSPSD